MSESLREWKYVGGRTVKMRLRIEHAWMPVVQVHAVTEDNKKEEK